MACPKCGSTWVADRSVLEVEGYRKHWYSIPTTVPYHVAYPNSKRFHCANCNHDFGEFPPAIKKGIVSGMNVKAAKEAIDACL